MGQTTILPLDNDPSRCGTRFGWPRTKPTKTRAGADAKQAALKQFTTDDHPVDDFAKAPPVTLVQARASLKVDEAGWKKSLEDATSIYRAYPEIQSLSAFCAVYGVERILREFRRNGDRARGGMRTACNICFDASAGRNAAGAFTGMDGCRNMKIADQRKTGGVFARGTRNVEALRNAPIVDEEYRGPVLFEADAADDVIAGLVGNNVLGRKPQLGAPNRTTGAFATSYKSRVLPPFMTPLTIRR